MSSFSLRDDRLADVCCLCRVTFDGVDDKEPVELDADEVQMTSAVMYMCTDQWECTKRYLEPVKRFRESASLVLKVFGVDTCPEGGHGVDTS